jgi:O-acetyl-ADP-ribose deacetylase (regulator of RNase III)
MEIITGNLIKLAQEGKFDIIVQGCNCHCTMGSGIASQLRELYPQVYEADCKTVPGDKSKLGTYTLAPTDEGFIVVNAYTQYNYNKSGESADLFEYKAFGLILLKLALKAEKGPVHFGFPAIGCGLAGGNKDIIYNLIRAFAVGVEKAGGTVTIVEFG